MARCAPSRGHRDICRQIRASADIDFMTGATPSRPAAGVTLPSDPAQREGLRRRGFAAVWARFREERFDEAQHNLRALLPLLDSLDDLWKWLTWTNVGAMLDPSWPTEELETLLRAREDIIYQSEGGQRK